MKCLTIQCINRHSAGDAEALKMNIGVDVLKLLFIIESLWDMTKALRESRSNQFLHLTITLSSLGNFIIGCYFLHFMKMTWFCLYCTFECVEGQLVGLSLCGLIPVVQLWFISLLPVWQILLFDCLLSPQLLENGCCLHVCLI